MPIIRNGPTCEDVLIFCVVVHLGSMLVPSISPKAPIIMYVVCYPTDVKMLPMIFVLVLVVVIGALMATSTTLEVSVARLTASCWTQAAFPKVLEAILETLAILDGDPEAAESPNPDGQEARPKLDHEIVPHRVSNDRHDEDGQGRHVGPGEDHDPPEGTKVGKLEVFGN